MRSLAALLVTALLTVAVPAAPRAAGPPPPGQVIALGGPITMHRQALQRVQAATGAVPEVLGSEDASTMSVAISQRVAPDGAAVAYVASDAAHADALAAATLLAAQPGPLLLVSPDTVPPVVAEELRRLAPDRIVVLGGPAAIGDPVLAQLTELTGAPTERVAGPDRFATAAAIAALAHPDGTDTVYVASGEDWADALAASAAIDATDAALLLTAHGFVPTATGEALDRLGPGAVVVLGGTAAVSQAVQDHLGALSGTTPTRLAGETRYETAAAINRDARPDGAAVTFAASGTDWVDALVAGPAVLAEDAALLLVDTTVVWPPPDLTAAVEVATARAGTTSLAVIGTDATMAGHQPERPVAAASTLKVMFLAAYLRQPSVRDRDLTESDLALLEPMITQSANAPATRIADALGPAPLQQLAAEAGMQDFAWTRPWGNSRTSARDMARLMLGLEGLLPERHRAYAMDLLTRVVPEQRWGIGQLDLPGWLLHFKGGWGSATGSVDHQAVLLQREDGTRVALAVMTTSSPSHAYATDTLQMVFGELLATLP